MQKKIEQNVLEKIKKGDIKMKPKLYFVVGSVVLFASLVGISLGLVFLFNLMIFVATRNATFSSWKVQTIISSFPWLIVILSIVSILAIYWLMKRYDISYKKNLPLLVIAVVLSLFLAGFMIEKMGVNDYLERGGMRGFYQNIENNYGMGKGMGGYGRRR